MNKIDYLTVGKLFTEWLAVNQTRTRVSIYANYVFKVEKHLLPAFGHLKLEKLTLVRVYDFIKTKQKNGLSNKYISDLVVVLKNMTKYVSRVHHCINPIADVELPKREKNKLNLDMLQ